MSLRIVSSDNMLVGNSVAVTVGAKTYPWTARISTSAMVFVNLAGTATAANFPIPEYDDSLIAIAAGETLSMIASEPDTLVTVAEIKLSA